MIPVLNPASAQDILDFGLAGIALSRYSGLWTALKTTAETAEQRGEHDAHDADDHGPVGDLGKDE